MSGAKGRVLFTVLAAASFVGLALSAWAWAVSIVPPYHEYGVPGFRHYHVTPMEGALNFYDRDSRGTFRIPADVHLLITALLAVPPVWWVAYAVRRRRHERRRLAAHGGFPVR